MAEAARSVSVVLKADIQDYVSKMGQASKATKDFAAQTGKVSGSASTATKNLGTSAKSASGDLDKATKSTKDFGTAAGKAATDADKASKSTKSVGDSATTLGIGMAAAGAAIAVGIGAAVKAFADFDKEMSNVRAVSGATAGQMLQLKDAALEAGAATKFSASDAASAEAELVKAGISVRDVLGGALRGSLDLAAAGNLDLANAATISAQAMNIFKLEGKDVGHIADVLAAGANKSAADVGQLGDALRQGGLVASQTGLSLEETTGILSAFADNALIGSDAGTSLKTMLQRLVPQSAAAASAMHDIGFSAYDASGNLKSAADIAENLQTGLAGLTNEQRDSTLATIFGSDAVRAANVLYKLGASGVQDYTKAVNDTGAASRVAAIQMDNLSGDLEQLRGSIETSLIQAGSGANDALRGLAQSARSLVDGFSGLPAGVQSSVIQLAALTSGVLLLGGAAATAIPKIVATKEAIDALSVSAPRAAGALGLLTKALAVVAVADVATQIRGIAAAAQVGDPAVNDLADSLKRMAENGKDAGAFGDLFARGAGPFRQTFEDASAALDDFGANANAATNSRWYETLFGTANEAESIFADRVEKIDKALVELVNSGHGDEAKKIVDRLSTSTEQFGGSADKVRESFTGYNAAVDGATVANGQFADSTGKIGPAAAGAAGQARLLGDEIKDQKKAAEDAQKAFKDLTDSVKNYGDLVAGALSATSGYEASIDKAAEVATKRKELQDQINALSAAGSGKGDIAKKFDAADAKTIKDFDQRIKDAKTEAEKARLRADKADTLASSQASRKDALSSNADQIARLKKEQEQYAATLDKGSAAGRANTDMLLDMARTAKDAAVENFVQTRSVDDLHKAIDGSRDTFIKQAQDFGATKDEASKLADQLGLTRDNVDKLAALPPADVTVNANTAAADAAIANTGALLDATDGKHATMTIDLKFGDKTISAEALAGLANGTLGPKGFAEGGYTGAGGKYEPKGVVHGGEFVFTKEETSKAGVVNLAALARSLRGYASGGPVSPFADRSLVSSAMTTHNINGGATTNDNRIAIENLHGLTLEQVRRDTDRQRRLHALGRRGAR